MKTQKKVIWYIARADLSREGDAEALHSRADVKEFNKLGWNATLFSCCHDLKKYNPRDNEVIIQNMSEKFERILYEIKLSVKIIFSKNKPDYIFFRGPSTLLIIGVTSWLARIPIILELNGVFGYRYRKNTPKDLFYKFGDYFFSKKSRLIIAVTEELSQLANREKGTSTRVVVSRNGVDFEEIKPASKITIKTNSFKIGFLGKLFQGRGIEDALKAISHLKNKGIIIELKTVGGGPAVDSLSQLARSLSIESQVEFLDAVPPNKMAEAVEDCNLMWASYERNPELDICGLSPLKIWTYLSLSKPVLIRDPGVLGHYHDVPGLIWINDEGHIGIADKLDEIINHTGISGLEKLGSTGREYVTQNVSWSNHVLTISNAINNSTQLL